MYDIINVLEYSSFYEGMKNHIMKKDRAIYEPFMEAIEAFVAEKQGIIGGLNGINLLIKSGKNIGSYYYELYFENALKAGQELADKLLEAYEAAPSLTREQVDPRTILMDTSVPYKVFIVSVYGRQLAKLFSVKKQGKISMINLLNPITVKGIFGKKGQIDLLCMSPRLQLIYLLQLGYRPYQELFQPLNYYEIWIKVNLLFKEIYKEFNIEIDNKIELLMSKNQFPDRWGFFGAMGFDTILGGNRPVSNKIKEAQKSFIADVAKNNDNIMIIGDFALDALGIIGYLSNAGSGSGAKSYRLQILAKMPINSIIKSIKGLKVNYAEYDLQLPFDIFLKKYTIYAKDDNSGRNVVFMDVFNSLEYEAIAFKKRGGVYYGSELAVLRFLLLDVYSLSLIAQIASEKPGSGEKNINKIIKTHISIILALYEYIILVIRSKEGGGPLEIFPPKNYIGTCVRESVLFRKLRENQQRFTSYFPAKKHKDDGNQSN